MAIDFSRLNDKTCDETSDTGAEAAVRLRREREREDEKFAELEPAAAKVMVTFDHRRDIDGLHLMATAERNGVTRRFSMTFDGLRQQILEKGLLNEINWRWTRAYEMAENFGTPFPTNEGPAIEVVVFGGWKKRSWKDARGKWHSAWDFHPAIWSYRDLDDRIVHHEGWEPHADAWLSSPSAQAAKAVSEDLAANGLVAGELVVERFAAA